MSQKFGDNLGQSVYSFMVTKTSTFERIPLLTLGSPDDDLMHFVSYFWNLSFTLPYTTQDSVIGCVSVFSWILGRHLPIRT
jgi:hypothetical protein